MSLSTQQSFAYLESPKGYSSMWITYMHLTLKLSPFGANPNYDITYKIFEMRH